MAHNSWPQVKCAEFASKKKYSVSYRKHTSIEALPNILDIHTSYFFYRKAYKFCDGCGKCGRAENLEAGHLKKCSALKPGQMAGFLIVGKMPKYNSDFVKAVLEE